MSSAVQDFLKKAHEDSALRKELHARFGEAGIPAKDLAVFAAGRGYKFSVDELTGELSDENLGAVSGGSLIYLKWDSVKRGEH